MQVDWLESGAHWWALQLPPCCPDYKNGSNGNCESGDAIESRFEEFGSKWLKGGSLA